MSVPLELVNGRSALLVTLSGDHVTLHADFASPPGSVLEVRIAGASARVKVKSCRRVEHDSETRFTIEGRFQNLSRAQRQALESAHSVNIS
ncbi:MAG: hypothetical protein DIU78_016960 [Pseudomonadota bacterium]|nr:MAG: hypothetical protein DIU78_13040 [Pseudomonadota bacterium]